MLRSTLNIQRERSRYKERREVSACTREQTVGLAAEVMNVSVNVALETNVRQ